MSISHLLLENSIQGFKKNSRLIFFLMSIQRDYLMRKSEKILKLILF